MERDEQSSEDGRNHGKEKPEAEVRGKDWSREKEN